MNGKLWYGKKNWAASTKSSNMCTSPLARQIGARTPITKRKHTASPPFSFSLEFFLIWILLICYSFKYACHVCRIKNTTKVIRYIVRSWHFKCMSVWWTIISSLKPESHSGWRWNQIYRVRKLLLSALNKFYELVAPLWKKNYFKYYWASDKIKLEAYTW